MSTPFTDPSVKKVFRQYPPQQRKKLLALRELIFATAKKSKDIGEVTETLKWGEPSYLTKYGSTIRINWKEQLENEYAMYFKCTSLLVPAFKKLYPNDFVYENNRAIHFKLNQRIPRKKLRHCIEMALTYHKIKNDLKDIV